MNRLLFKRFYSFAGQRYQRNADLKSKTGNSFKAAQLKKTLRTQLSPLPPFEATKLPFGFHHTDHMTSIDWCKKNGWHTPEIIPFQNLQMHPFSSSLHYAIQCFEGLKAYRNQKGEIRLFRPDCNIYRLKQSTQRLALPDFDGDEFLKILDEFVKIEERWIPPIKEFSLYLRPLHIATQPTLGVKIANNSKLLIMAGPVGPYYPTGFAPISLSCGTQTIRAARKGTGHYKIGGNYSPTLRTSHAVQQQGHQQVLWLLEDQVIEVGASNIFFVFKKGTQTTIVTPDLEDLILPGVTRDSILTLLQDQKEYKVEERRIMIQEVLERHAKGQLVQCFGAGTAVIVSPVKNIEYKGKNYGIPIDPQLNAGPISLKIRNQMLQIQEGRAEDKFGWIRRVK